MLPRRLTLRWFRKAAMKDVEAARTRPLGTTRDDDRSRASNNPPGTSGWKMRPNGLDPYGDVKNSQMIFRFKSKSIGNPKRIRVAVTAEHYDLTSDDGSVRSIKDHLVGKRKFTRWVKR